MYNLAVILFVAFWNLGLPTQAQGPAIYDDEILATVDGSNIALESFRSNYVSYLNKTGQGDSDRLRLAFLESQIGQKIVIDQMRSLDHQDTPAYQKVLGTIRRKLLVEGYLSEDRYSNIRISENDLREMFVRTNTSIKASHLYAPTRKAADSLYALLMQGADFSALAKNVFSDSVLAENGGSLGFFDYDEMDPAFEDAAYSLEIGEISKPVRTSQGFSIIKVEKKRRKNYSTYEPA